jgi:hypothetical protein
MEVEAVLDRMHGQREAVGILVHVRLLQNAELEESSIELSNAQAKVSVIHRVVSVFIWRIVVVAYSKAFFR